MTPQFPEHQCSLTLEHNPHLSGCETAEEWLSHDHNREQYDWKDEESMQRARDTNEIWTLQWYPDTPVGFCAVAAPTYDELLALALE